MGLPGCSYMDGFPSGQRGQTVNLLQIASVVRIHLHPHAAVAELADAQDLKSCGGDIVPVRFRSAAAKKTLSIGSTVFRVFSFYIGCVMTVKYRNVIIKYIRMMYRVERG